MRGYVRGVGVCSHVVMSTQYLLRHVLWGEATCNTRGRQQYHNVSAVRVEVCGNRFWGELGWCTRVLYPVVHIVRPS